MWELAGETDWLLPVILPHVMLIYKVMGGQVSNTHPFDCSPTDSLGRLTIAWVDIVPLGGSLVGVV